jgi:hypothetical protein
VTGHSGIVPTGSGIVTSDSGIVTSHSGQALKLGTMDRNGWARCAGMAGHDGPESVGTMARNTHVGFTRRLSPVAHHAFFGVQVGPPQTFMFKNNIKKRRRDLPSVPFSFEASRWLRFVALMGCRCGAVFHRLQFGSHVGLFLLQDCALFHFTLLFSSLAR